MGVLRFVRVAALLLLISSAVAMQAQEPPKTEPQKPVMQDAPKPPATPLPEDPLPIAGDALYSPLAVGRGSESLKTKWDSYLVISFGPRALVSPLITSGFRMAFPNYNYPNDWHQGMQGFGRLYGSAYGTKVALETGRFGAGALLHEDFRYRPSESKNFGVRLGHAILFTFVDRSDTGTPRLAVANFVGAAAGGFTPNLWLPDGFNNPRHGVTRSLTKLGIFAGQNVAREFAPELFKGFQTLHLPGPRLPVPPWWTKGITIRQ